MGESRISAAEQFISTAVPCSTDIISFVFDKRKYRANHYSLSQAKPMNGKII